MGVMIGKTAFMLAFAMAIRWTLPRFRFDQLMKLAWQGMIPVSILLLAAAATVTYFGVDQYMWLASIGCAVIIWAVYPWMPKQDAANRRIPLIGSRFSPLPNERAATVSTHPVALDDAAIPDRRQGPLSVH
jgi:NADH-quinone oxidoreductase subunit H